MHRLLSFMRVTALFSSGAVILSGVGAARAQQEEALHAAYSFEDGLQNFAPNGGGVSITQSTIGATDGTQSMRVSIVQGAFFVGALTDNLAPQVGDPPGLDFVVFDLTLTEAFPDGEGTYVDAGITIFGASQPDYPGGQLFGLQVQFFDDQVSLGDLPVGTHEVRIDLTTWTHPLTFETGQTFRQIFGAVGSGPDDVIPTGFQIYFNKSTNAPWTGYIDNIRLGVYLDADFNVDEAVNGADFGIWKSAFGTGVEGDADGDLDTDGADFLIWQRQFGSPVVVGSAVPEPAAISLLGVAVVAAGANRWGGRPRRPA